MTFIHDIPQKYLTHSSYLGTFFNQQEIIFSYFSMKNMLWVLARKASSRPSYCTHNACFRRENENYQNTPPIGSYANIKRTLQPKLYDLYT